MTTHQKLWQLLTRPQKRAAVALFILMLIGMALETLGIGLIIPALALMTQGDLSEKYPVMAPWLDRLGNPNRERLVGFGMLTLVVVYAVKTLFLSFLAWRQTRFIFGLQENISQRLFTGYLHQPYTFHLQRNSAHLIRNTIGQVNDIVNVFQLGLTLIAETLVLLGIALLLIMIEPIGTVSIVGTLGLVGWSFNHFTRSRILRWGEQREHHEGMRIKHLQQGLGGVKDVKFFGREKEFLSQYQIHNAGSAHAGRRQSMLQALPRLMLEFLAVTGLAALVLVMIAQGKPTEELLPALGLFAAGAFRILPSVNRVLSAIHNVRFSLPVINTLHNELCLLESTPPPRQGKHIPLKHALILDQVSFYFSASNSPVLDKISMEIPKGSSVGFVGGSGAGKSTLVDVILGLLTPIDGTVKVDGIDIQDNLRGWQDQIGYVPQSIFLTDDTLRRNVAFGLPNDQIDEAAVWRAIRAAQLEQFVNELPHGLDTMVGERGIRLSGGQRQRIGIARALFHDPAVLVLDEATSSLDIATETEVMGAVRALHGNKTIIIVAHRLSTIEHCDRLFRLEHGKLTDNSTDAFVLSATAN